MFESEIQSYSYVHCFQTPFAPLCPEGHIFLTEIAANAKKGMVINMIVYTPFWETLKRSGESTYTLINKHGISSATIDRIRHNKGISTLKIDDLCRILKCRVEDIILYVDD